MEEMSTYLDLIQFIKNLNSNITITLDFFDNDSYELTFSYSDNKQCVVVKNLKSDRKELWGVYTVDYSYVDTFDSSYEHMFDGLDKLQNFLPKYSEKHLF